MLSLDELSKQIEACCSGRIDLESFEDWFQQRSWGSYDRSGDTLSDAIFLVRAALSSCDPDEVDEIALREELANAVRPFALSKVSVLRLVPIQEMSASDEVAQTREQHEVERKSSIEFDLLRKPPSEQLSFVHERARLSATA
jgi:hypothetical protein